MRTQLFPNSCGFEVSEMWCPLTDLETYFISIGLTLITIFVLHFIMVSQRKKQKLRSKE